MHKDARRHRTGLAVSRGANARLAWLAILLPAILFPTGRARAAWRPDGKGAGESFEDDRVPAYVTADRSTVTVSAKRYKHGRRSLCWSTAPGALLRIASPALKATAASRNAGVMLWYYSERPQSGKLTVEFLSGGVAVYRFPLGLAFRGWRAAWVSFRGDLKPLTPGARLKGDAVMTVAAPAGGAGDIYLDAVRFTAGSSWRRSRDRQVPFVKASAATHWQASYDASLIEPPPATAPVTAEHRAAFASMTRRYEDWALGRTLSKDDPRTSPILKAMQSHISRGKAYYRKLGITYADGAYTGQPFFASRSSLKPDFCRDLFQNAPVALALDYRVNGNRESARDFVTLVNFANDQGWADGSAIGSLDHEMLRAAGYMHAVFLMRDVLRDAGVLERELATIRWHCFFNMVYREPVHPGANADRMRTVTLYMLLAVLAMEDTPEKLRDMTHLLRWQTNACRIAPGWADTIKPDFTGFHHAGVYANAYSPGAFHVASFAAYLQHGTPFAFSNESLQNLKQALLVARVMSNLYETPSPISGRMPFCGPTWLLHSPAFAYLAVAAGDDELAAAFKRLWTRASAEQRVSTLLRQGVSISWYAPPGMLSVLERALARPVAAEASPEGNWSMPYGALSVQRRGDWMALVKGCGRYVWDVEKQHDQNVYGLFVSYGSVTLHCAGSPVTATASGLVADGWDWRLWPGTTAPCLPYEELAKHERVRNFSASRFAAGVTNGRDGVFGLDLRADRYGFELAAKKSVFMKDDLLVCLGSDIFVSGTDAPVNTCVFQTALPSRESPTRIGGRKVDEFPREHGTRAAATLTDAVGNRYLVPAGQDLRVRRGRQESRHERSRRPTHGDFATAWLSHGASPAGASYHYAIQVQSGADTTPAYTVLQRDAAAHVVRFPRGYTGYCIFDAGKRLPDGDIARVDVPCLAMVEREGRRLALAVANPDLDFAVERAPANLDRLRGDAWYAPARPAPVRVTVKGRWRVPAGAGAQVVSREEGATVVEFPCIHGRSVSISLEP
ncbi:MAG: chondroitinase family polysaccharide lyase [Planctomycetota bacterium]|jgi:hypothetical protein